MKKSNHLTLATACTLLRIFLIPCIIYSITHNCHWTALSLFLVAILTDFLDGFFARMLNQKTVLGACLDPIADKLLMISCCVTFWMINFFVPGWFLVFVVAKEIMQVVGACYVYCVIGVCDVRPTMYGKITAVMQMIFIAWLLMIRCGVLSSLRYLSYYCLYAVAVCMAISFIQYGSIGLNMIKKRT